MHISSEHVFYEGFLAGFLVHFETYCTENYAVFILENWLFKKLFSNI